MAFDTDPDLARRLAALCHPKLRQIEPGLERVERLLAALGSPHLHLPPVIHLAGTNGKGSTLAMLRAMLEAAGKRVHAYTSPHLISFTERMLVAGQPVSRAALDEILAKIEALQAEYPATFFEATTVAAFCTFAEVEADYVLLETGLGGRLDASNVLPAAALAATIITPIGMDHQDFLGDTIEQIAAEKAGILRAGVPAIIAPQPPQVLPVLQAICPDARWQFAGKEWQFAYESGAEIWQFQSRDGEAVTLSLPALVGEHQVMNAAVAVACMRQIMPEIPAEKLAEGLQKAVWAGRLQRLDSGYWRRNLPAKTQLWIDGAHNAMAADTLARWVAQQPESFALIIAMKQDKGIAAFLAPWQDIAARLLVIPLPSDEAGHDPADIVAEAHRLELPAEHVASLEEALAMAAQTHKCILVTGSLYLVGYALQKNCEEA